jgi:hypothetical protein
MSVAGRACGCRFGRFIFNDTTVLDERLFIAGAVMAAVAIAVIAAMTLAAFLRTTAPAPLAAPAVAAVAGDATQHRHAPSPRD